MDRYSRIVAWLRVLLPLAALALLSTLFLLSRNSDPVAAVPFADAELSDRVEGEQITGPFFSGMTNSGDRVTVTAGTMRTGLGQASEVDDLSAQIDLVSGTRVILFSDQGRFDMARAQSELEGNVVITTSRGMKLVTDSLSANFDHMVIEAPETLMTGPLGRLNSGQMRLEQRGEAGSAHFIFTDGVKLIYDPHNSQE